MPQLSILVGLACGLAVWLALDWMQPKAVRAIFTQELQRRLDQQARESLIRFDQYVQLHASTTRLLAHHRKLANYVDSTLWFATDDAPPILHDTLPGWLPPSFRWQPLISPGVVMLLDNWSRTRETYPMAGVDAPPELMQLPSLYLEESEVQAYLTTLGNRPYLLSSEPVDNAAGNPVGRLMFAAPIDDRFLAASQARTASDTAIVALVDGEDQRVLASSAPAQLPAGTYLPAVRAAFEVTTQSFFEYEGSDINAEFATLIPSSVAKATRDQVLGLERRQRLITAIAFVSAFTLVFFLLSRQLSRTLRRVSVLSRRALGIDQPAEVQGNQLLALEDWVRQFIRTVRDSRDAMQRQHASEIEERETLKRAIMEGALDAIVTTDEAGAIIDCNTTAEGTFGITRDDAAGRELDALLESGSRGQFRYCLHQVAEGGEGAVQGDEVHEMRAMRADGTIIPVDVAIRPIRLGNRMVFTVYLRDVTQRKVREMEIQSLARFPGESPQPILRVDHHGVIQYANAASRPLLEYWGCTPDEALPRFWREKALQVARTHTNLELAEDSGAWIYMLLFRPVAEFGYVNIYGRDITRERQVERTAREHQQELVHVCRLSTMGEMSTGLAHELNQPLAAISNFAAGCVRRLQYNTGDKEEIIDALRQITRQANRAGEIIRRLRGLVGKQPSSRSRADLNEVARETCSFVEFQACKLGILIEQRFAAEPLQARLDVVQIEQILLNLIRNALDALEEVPHADRSLVVSTGAEEGQGWVRVQDTGPGLAPEVVDRLFHPFFTTKESGMGVGLAISQTIAQDHGGRLTFESTPGKGATFTLWLPLSVGTRTTTAIETTQTTETNPT